MCVERRLVLFLEETKRGVDEKPAGGFLIHKAFRFFEEQDKASLDAQKREEEERNE